MKHLSILGIALYSLLANAGWFGPSNYEECVIDGMKSVKNSVAANAIKSACSTKFTTNPTAFQSTYLLSKISTYSPTLVTLINNLELAHFSKIEERNVWARRPSGGRVFGTDRYMQVEVLNKNGFQIVGIEVGIPKNSVCASSVNDYSEVYFCEGSSDSFATGVFRCDIPRLESRDVDELCITGFSYSASKSGFAYFQKKYKIPQ